MRLPVQLQRAMAAEAEAAREARAKVGYFKKLYVSEYCITSHLIFFYFFEMSNILGDSGRGRKESIKSP